MTMLLLLLMMMMMMMTIIGAIGAPTNKKTVKPRPDDHQRHDERDGHEDDEARCRSPAPLALAESRGPGRYAFAAVRGAGRAGRAALPADAALTVR